MFATIPVDMSLIPRKDPHNGKRELTPTCAVACTNTCTEWGAHRHIDTHSHTNKYMTNVKSYAEYISEPG